MTKRILSLFIVFLGVVSISNAQITEKPNFGKIALLNATIHTVSDGVIENGIVLIDGERIVFVGNNVKPTADYTMIDLTGKHIWPGMIDAGTSLGLIEISAVPVTVDNAEVGNFNPNMRAFTAINPNSAAIAINRVEGVTTVIAEPSSGLISGVATLIDLFGYSPDSMAVKADAAMIMNWPISGRRGWFDQRTDEQLKEQFETQLKEMKETWNKAKFYHTMMSAFEASPSGKTQPDKDQQMEGMRNVFRGTLPVMIRVDREGDIKEALKWVADNPDVKFIFTSVAEGWRVADEIAAANVPVIVGPVLRLPSRGYDHYLRPYQNAGLLHKAGVLVALRTGQTENVRNLPFQAGYAATYGMPYDEAVKSITLNPAKIFGVDDRIGSISEGKIANLVVTNGDLLETMTQVEMVFIRGRDIPLTSRQEQLYRQFINRDATN
jgi:imidazolonepropionase-like amidohydrolase